MPSAAPELRETSGITSRLILGYAERAGGREAVEQVLERAGCAGREAELLDESTWFSLQTKLRLFEALTEVLEDPHATRHAGEAALDIGVAEGFKLTLRALGSPRVVYQHIVRANNKFSAIHTMELLELSTSSATIAFHDHAGYDVHRLDCDYNIGLLKVVPRLFGFPAARISHPRCCVDGDDHCVYDVTWEPGAVSTRAMVATAAGAAAAIAGAAVAAPALLPVAGVAVLGAGAELARRLAGDRRARWRRMEEELRDKDEAAERLTASLHDLAGELDLAEVHEKIVRNARVTVISKDFLLLVDEDGTLRRASATGLPDASVTAIEGWAAARGDADGEPLLVEDVRAVPALAPLLHDAHMPVGSLCRVPLVALGATIGHLVALAPQARTFLPRDVDLIHSYARQAAIALVNARTFTTQRDLATRDSLTGLLNHREFHESLDRELERVRRHGGPLSVALFDLDGFKLVNDSGGHAEGDRLLQGVAEAMRRTGRASDVPFRIGGDEFAVLLPETAAEEAEAVVRRVAAAVSGVDRRAGTSWGVATWPADGGSKDVLVAQADARLYEMKGADRRGGRTAPAAGDRAAAKAQRSRLAAASRLAPQLDAARSPQEVAEVTIDGLRGSLDYAVAYLQQVAGDELRTVAVGGRLTDGVDVPLWAMPLERGVTGRVARTGEPAVVQDTSEDPDHVPVTAVVPDTDVVLLSQIAVPLRVAGRTWGVLTVLDTERAAFASDDVLLLETVGAQAAAALHRAELLGELDGAFAATRAALGATDAGALAERVGARLGLATAALRELRYAALLQRAGRDAAAVDAATAFGAAVHRLVRAAAERFDGTGPEGLAGEAIPLGARVLAACAVLDAPAGGPSPDTLDRVRRAAGSALDPAVADALLAELAAGAAPVG